MQLNGVLMLKIVYLSFFFFKYKSNSNSDTMLNILNILATQCIIQYCVTVGRSKLEESKAMREIVCSTFGSKCQRVPR